LRREFPRYTCFVAMPSEATREFVVTDDFILVPNPRECDPARCYVVAFRAQRLGMGGSRR
jgi:hypothetical protein